jgi:hypothetical protein
VKEIQDFIHENFVPVWVDDSKDARFAGTTLGLPDKGYPNVAVYGPGQEYVQRIVGFVGNPAPDTWFGMVKDSVATSKRLAALRADAAKNPSAWLEVAAVLSDIEGREADALAAAEQVPAANRDEAFTAALRMHRARAKWVEVRTGIDDAIAAARASGGDPDAQKRALEGIYAGALTELDDFLRDHRAACGRSAPRALALKVRFHMILENRAAALAVAKILLEEYPESPETESMLRGIR